MHAICAREKSIKTFYDQQSQMNMKRTHAHWCTKVLVSCRVVRKYGEYCGFLNSYLRHNNKSVKTDFKYDKNLQIWKHVFTKSVFKM